MSTIPPPKPTISPFGVSQPFEDYTEPVPIVFGTHRVTTKVVLTGTVYGPLDINWNYHGSTDATREFWGGGVGAGVYAICQGPAIGPTGRYWRGDALCTPEMMMAPGIADNSPGMGSGKWRTSDRRNYYGDGSKSTGAPVSMVWDYQSGSSTTAWAGLSSSTDNNYMTILITKYWTLGGGWMAPGTGIDAHPERAVPLLGTAHLRLGGLDLGVGGATLPTIDVEIIGFSGTISDGRFPGVYDCNPADVVKDIITNPVYGLGLSASYVEVDVGGDGSVSSSYRNYCQSMGFQVSRVVSSQTDVDTLLQELLNSTNAVAFWEEGRYKVRPLGDAITGSYVPVSAAYALGVDDFLTDSGQEPVVVERLPLVEAYNTVPVTYYDRSGSYQPITIQNPVVDDVSTRGMIRTDPVDLPWVITGSHAAAISNLMGRRYINVRNRYRFTLGSRYSLLEPADLLLLTEPVLGLSGTQVRITSIETTGGDRNVIAEDCPLSFCAPVVLNQQVSDGRADVVGWPTTLPASSSLATSLSATSVAVDTATTASQVATTASVTATSAYATASMVSSSVYDGSTGLSSRALTDLSNALNNSVALRLIPSGSLTGSSLAVGAIGTREVAANSIIASRLVLTDFENLWPNGDSETAGPPNFTGSVTATLPDLGWRENVSSGSAWNGTWVRRWAGGGNTLSNLFKVSPGDQFYTELYTRTGPTHDGGRGYYDLAWLDLSGTAIGGVTASVQISSSAWTQLSMSVTAPTSATQGRMRLWSLTTGTNADQMFDGIVIRRKNNATMIVDGAVQANHISASTIQGTHISASAIQSQHIAASSIYASHLSAGSITADKMTVGSVSGTTIASGTITTANISASSITAGLIQAGAVTAQKLSADALQTSNYSYTGTLNGVDEVALTGAKMQSSGTNLLVAANALKIGTTLLSDTWLGQTWYAAGNIWHTTNAVSGSGYGIYGVTTGSYGSSPLNAWTFVRVTLSGTVPNLGANMWLAVSVQQAGYRGFGTSGDSAFRSSFPLVTDVHYSSSPNSAYFDVAFADTNGNHLAVGSYTWTMSFQVQAMPQTWTGHS